MSLPAIENSPCFRAIAPISQSGDRGSGQSDEDRRPIGPVRFSKYLERINIEDRVELRTNSRSQAANAERGRTATAPSAVPTPVRETATPASIEKAYGSKVATVRGRFIDTMG